MNTLADLLVDNGGYSVNPWGDGFVLRIHNPPMRGYGGRTVEFTAPTVDLVFDIARLGLIRAQEADYASDVVYNLEKIIELYEDHKDPNLEKVASKAKKALIYARGQLVTAEAARDACLPD